MKTRWQNQPGSARHRRAFTLIEVLITMVTTVVVMGGAMAAYIYGLKMMQFTQPKLTASDDARKVITLLTEDIRSAHKIKIGSNINNMFVEVPIKKPKVGNAIVVYPSTNTNQFVIYFLDPANQLLKRSTNNATTPTVLAASISNAVNTPIFTAEDYRGFTLTNEIDNYVIAMTLQFHQLRYPSVAVGTNNYYDWYQLQSKVTKRIH